jgi:hypothetical protein
MTAMAVLLEQVIRSVEAMSADGRQAGGRTSATADP